jgi:hypothetical protein
MILSHTLLSFFSFFLSFFPSFLSFFFLSQSVSYTYSLYVQVVIIAPGHTQWNTHTHTHTHTYKHGRTPLDEGSASRKILYLTTHNTHKRQSCAGRIRTCNPSQRAAAVLRLTTRGHWDQPVTYLLEKNLADDDDDDKHAVHTIFTTTNKKYWLE